MGSKAAGSKAAGSYDATLWGVIGIGFDIVGDTGGALRFVVKQFSVHDGFSATTFPIAPWAVPLRTASTS